MSIDLSFAHGVNLESDGKSLADKHITDAFNNKAAEFGSTSGSKDKADSQAESAAASGAVSVGSSATEDYLAPTQTESTQNTKSAEEERLAEYAKQALKNQEHDSGLRSESNQSNTLGRSFTP